MLVNIEWRYCGDSHWLYLCTMHESRAAAALEELRGNADALYRRRVADGYLMTRATEYRAA
jgi:hypothetical protein